LSYLVDSTAAPVAAIAFITTWIGAELGYIGDGIAELKVPKGFDMPSPYGIFMGSLQYSFYPVLTLIFMLILIMRNRDFGPMLKAEVRARTTGAVSAPAERKAIDREKEQELDDLEPVHGAIPRWFNAVLPILVVIIGTVVGLIYTGYSPETWNDATLGFTRKLSLTIGSADSYSALLWASLGGLGTAIILTLIQRIMNLGLVIESVLGGFKTMLHAMIILILAWSLAKVTKDLHTADYITSLLSAGISPYLIPAITFLLAAVVSFSTGSSWGTMAILYPLLIPAVWSVSLDTGLTPDAALPLLYNTVACVLAGSVLGDHCSPISDTTILSSLATSTNHIDHVRTQLPYALTVGLVCVLVGTLPAAYGVPGWITFPLAIGILFAIIQFVGKPVPDTPGHRAE
jgi:Na+/H+ antiporter NhaC